MDVIPPVVQPARSIWVKNGHALSDIEGTHFRRRQELEQVATTLTGKSKRVDIERVDR
jgi:hypothetical protein